jgi:hypothetical protein
MEIELAKKQRRFLVQWSILNLFGWLIGFCFVFIIGISLENIMYLAWKHNMTSNFGEVWLGESVLIWFPLGLCLGILQWLKLRYIGIKLLTWTFVSLVGGVVLIIFFSWILKFNSFEYQTKYDIPDWILTLGIATSFPVGGAIFGSIQSIPLREHVTRTDTWIKAYVIGFLLPPIIAPAAYLAKSFFLDFLYSNELYSLVDMRWFLFFSFLIITTSVIISVLTGNILLKHSNINSVKIKTG